jgi:endonuclease/exonuclease/phosphatase family metal-dependent hydrolase
MAVDSDQLKIATWNIGGGILGEAHQTNGHPDLEYHAELLKKNRPNIICLQESHHYLDDSTNQTERLANLLGYEFSQSTPISPSHLDQRAHLALGLISDYPITSSNYTEFKNPQLTAIGPQGKQWTLFDKGFCTYRLNLKSGLFTIVNAHCFPLHYFSAMATEERFRHIWKTLISGLEAARTGTQCLAAIDLNFEDICSVLTPELSIDRYINAIDSTPTTPKGMQQDFILYTSNFRLLTTSVIPTKADHHLCIADFVIEDM